MCILRDLEEAPEFKNRLNDLVWTNATEPRLTLVGRDMTLRRDAQDSGGTLRARRITANLDVGKRIQRVKKMLLDQLENWDAARRRAFADFLLDRVLVTVNVPTDPRLGRQIFVTTNLYGKRLDSMAILKGLITDLAASDAESADVVRLWTQASDVTGTTFEDFMRAFDVIERAAIDDKGKVAIQQDDWHLDLGAHLALRYPNGGIGNWMTRLVAYSHRWSELLTCLDGGGNEPMEQNICRLSVLGWTEWQPLALFYWAEHERLTKHKPDGYEKRVRRIEGLFDKLHRRSIAFTLGQTSGARALIFAKAVAQAKLGQNPTQYARKGSTEQDGALVVFKETRIRIDRMLRSQIKTSDLWGPLMKWLEMTRWRDGLPELIQQGSVEHVSPRNPDVDELASSDDYDRDCYSLGNLAVINSVVNKRLENKLYNEKRPELLKQAEKYDTITTIVANEEWTSTLIAARAEALRVEAWRQLGLQSPSPPAA